MNESTHDSLGTSVSLEELLPIVCRPDRDPADVTRHASYMIENDKTLGVILSLDEHRVELSEDNAEVESELTRLEFKLNLVLELVGQVLSHNLNLPPRTSVRLSVNEVEWACARPPKRGAHVWVELYLSPHFPRPVWLPGLVTNVRHGPKKQKWVRAALDPLSPLAQEHLEKLIFRSHRRHVALSRKSKPAG
jgi:hypothetical protein